MKNLIKIIGIIAVVAMIGLTVVSCASYATVQNVPQKTIPILGWVSGSVLPTGEEIASYTIFYGICIGYDDFVEAINGKNYDIVVKNYYIVQKVIAVAK
jgi:hypothetical protein